MKIEDLLMSASADDYDSLQALSRELIRSGYGIGGKLFIPDIGTNLMLISDWEFPLYYNEHRNWKIAKDIWGIEVKGFAGSVDSTKMVTIKSGTVLRVDRIYIRKGLKEFSSVSFLVTFPDKKKGRFWAKLSDVNRIACEIIKKDLKTKYDGKSLVAWRKYLRGLFDIEGFPSDLATLAKNIWDHTHSLLPVPQSGADEDYNEMSFCWDKEQHHLEFCFSRNEIDWMYRDRTNEKVVSGGEIAMDGYAGSIYRIASIYSRFF